MHRISKASVRLLQSNQKLRETTPTPTPVLQRNGSGGGGQAAGQLGTGTSGSGSMGPSPHLMRRGKFGTNRDFWRLFLDCVCIKLSHKRETRVWHCCFSKPIYQPLFKVPRSRLLPLPNPQTLLPASPAIQQTTPRPPSPPSLSAPLRDPCPATRPPRPPLLPYSHVPRPGATLVTSHRSKPPAIHPPNLQLRPALRSSPAVTSRALNPLLQARRPLQTPLHPPLPARM